MPARTSRNRNIEHHDHKAKGCAQGQKRHLPLLQSAANNPLVYGPDWDHHPVEDTIGLRAQVSIRNMHTILLSRWGNIILTIVLPNLKKFLPQGISSSLFRWWLKKVFHASPLGRGQPIADLFDFLSFPLDDQDFQAIVIIQVNVGGGNN
jgi:hypothetical protein